MSSTAHYTITAEEFQVRVQNNLDTATAHAHIYWYAIAGSLLLSLVLRTLVQLESRAWSRKINDEQSYDLGRPCEQTRPLRMVHIPVWQRILRASIVFIRKYFSYVPLPSMGVSLAEASVVAAYLGLYIFLLVDDTPNIPPNEIAPFTIIGIANRAGLLTVAALPLNIVLSTRISVVGWFSGVSFDKLHYLHRWIGRSTLAMAVVHATCKLIQMHTFGDHSYRQFGLGAFCIVAFLIVWTNRYFRRQFYELFVVGHTLGVVALIVMIWLHIPRQKPYLISSIGIWVADRVYRWIRIFAFNGLWRFGQWRALRNTATLRLLSHDTTRLEIHRPDFSWWKPGAYAYISTPGMSKWPQSHPFSIASRPNRAALLRRQHGTNSASPSQKSFIAPSSNEPNLIFLIRARTGWTRDLHDLAKRTSNPTIPVLVDGPYDGTPELHKVFDTVILFAGGAGISWTLPILTDLVDRSSLHQSSVRRIIWVCVMRHYVNYDWFFNELEAIVHASGNAWLDVRIHYTTNAEDIDMVPTFFRPGRPDIGSIIEEAVNSAQGRTFIGVAGPHGPSEEVRRCARKMASPSAILRGDSRGDVQFFSEQFGW